MQANITTVNNEQGSAFTDALNRECHGVCDKMNVTFSYCNLHVADAIGLISKFLHSLLPHVDVSLNDTLITCSTNTYAYRACIETLLTYKL